MHAKAPWERPSAASKREVARYARALADVATEFERILPAIPHGKMDATLAVGCIVATFARRFRLIALLLRDRHIAEAAILSRTLIDLCVASAYLTDSAGMKREHLASRFLSFEDVELYRWVRRQVPDSAGDPVLDRIAANASRVARLFEDIQEKAIIGWSGKSQDQMVSSIRDRDLRESLKTLRTKFGPLLSAFVHPTPIGVGATQFWDVLAPSHIAKSCWLCGGLLLYALVRVDVDVSDACEVLSNHLERLFGRRADRSKDDAMAALPLFTWASNAGRR